MLAAAAVSHDVTFAADNPTEREEGVERGQRRGREERDEEVERGQRRER